MKLSIVVPVFTQAGNVYEFVNGVEEHAKKVADEFEIVLTTNQSFDFVEKMHARLENRVHLVAVRETDDYQQVVMAGVDRSNGDATIIMTPDYSPKLIDEMVKEWKNGKDVVCLRRKHGKVGQFIAKLRLKIYNFFLFMFGDIFSLGILKDAQLLDKKIVDKMKAEQDLAHRVRTMYAPLDYNTAVMNIEHPIERFETKGTPKFDFWLGSVGAVVTLIAMVTAFLLAGAMSAPIWFWTITIIFGLLFEFVFLALLVNATARVKIGILHNTDEQGRIYNAVQEYYIAEVVRNNTTQVKATATKRTAKPKAVSVENSVSDAKGEVVETKVGAQVDLEKTTAKRTKKLSSATNSSEPKQSPKSKTAKKTEPKASAPIKAKTTKTTKSVLGSENKNAGTTSTKKTATNKSAGGSAKTNVKKTKEQSVKSSKTEETAKEINAVESSAETATKKPVKRSVKLDKNKDTSGSNG